MKNYIIISTLISRTRTLFHLGKRFWFFVFKGKRERTNVLKEGKGGVDHLKGSREEEEGRGRDIREGDVIFEVRADGNSWAYKNIVIELSGASGYIVYIKGEQEGWEEADTITCTVPNQAAIFTLLDYLVDKQRPLFSSNAEYKPLC